MAVTVLPVAVQSVPITTKAVCTLDLQLRKYIFNSLFSKGLALFMVFNDSFIKISGISWRSVLKL
jgi:hypothetical protein